MPATLEQALARLDAFEQIVGRCKHLDDDIRELRASMDGLNARIAQLDANALQGIQAAAQEARAARDLVEAQRSRFSAIDGRFLQLEKTAR